jgi:hypothetical protein
MRYLDCRRFGANENAAVVEAQYQGLSGPGKRVVWLLVLAVVVITIKILLE